MHGIDARRRFGGLTRIFVTMSRKVRLIARASRATPPTQGVTMDAAVWYSAQCALRRQKHAAELENWAGTHAAGRGGPSLQTAVFGHFKSDVSPMSQQAWILYEDLIRRQYRTGLKFMQPDGTFVERALDPKALNDVSGYWRTDDDDLVIAL